MELLVVQQGRNRDFSRALERLAQAYVRSVERERIEREAGAFHEPRKWRSGLHKRLARLKRCSWK